MKYTIKEFLVEFLVVVATIYFFFNISQVLKGQQPLQAPEPIMISQAPETICDCYETNQCMCPAGTCDCEWCDYQKSWDYCKQNQESIVIFVNYYDEEKWQGLFCKKLYMTRFPEIEKGIVVGRPTDDGSVRLDLSHTTSLDRIKQLAGLKSIVWKTERTPQSTYYRPITYFNSTPSFSGNVRSAVCVGNT